jgi:hypothetical protein
MKQDIKQILTKVVHSASELEQHLDCWEDLACNASEPNIFYEPGPLLAALNNAGKKLAFMCLLIFYKDLSDQSKKEQLIGLFPFQYQKETRWPRCGIYQTFTHQHCYLSTPLVHKEHIAETLNCFFDWVNSTPNGVRLFRLHRMNGTGILAEAFQHKIKQYQQPTIHGRCYQRAFISLKGCPEKYINQSLSKHKQKEYRRLRRRLQEQGTIRLETALDDPQHQWLDMFLALEASGWKGRHGHAMDNNSGDSGFFYDLIDSLGKRKRLILHTLWLDDHAVAMKCNLISADEQSSFAFKISYDEKYSLFSPGVLLELDNIYDLFNKHPQLHWMDSCADPNHPMIDHLWRERRTIDDFIIGNRKISSHIKILFLKLQKRMARQGE